MTTPAAKLWVCADCGVLNTSTEPIPELPPGYALEYLCDACYRAWKEHGEDGSVTSKSRNPLI